VLAMVDRPTDRQMGGTRELRCKRKACDTLLARLINASLVCLDGTRVGPMQPGQVISRRCIRCRLHNLFWV